MYKKSKEHIEKIRQLRIGTHHTEEWKKKHSERMSGKNHPNFKGRISSHGYTYIKKPEHPYSNSLGNIAEHRLIYEESRNCCLLSWIDIHHLDGNKSNNVWYNLLPIDHIQHVILEQIIYKPDHKCVVCGSEKTVINKKNGRKRWRRGMCNKCYKRISKTNI